MNHRIISTALLCFVALAIVAVLSGRLAGAEEKSATEKIRITYAANTLSFLVMFIAKDRGFTSSTVSMPI
jgi:VIT1/CCC1 family predicted Fe2+/Mn2+ transporter